MPSDSARLDVVHEALRRCWTDYRESALLAAEEVAGLLRTTREAGPVERAPAFAAALGALGSAHIDFDRLAPFFGTQPALGGTALDAIAAAGVVLREVADTPSAAPVDLPAGGDLADAVAHALARAGRAFGAAHVVALARSGRYDRAAHESWLQGYPFARWNRRERQLAPPVVVVLSGADLRAAGLAEFLDGQVKLVLVVRDEVAPPAPLVRLITPAAYLVQSHDGTQLLAVAAYPGPGVLAWMPASAAAFVHDPLASPVLGARVRLLSDPPPPRRGLGGLSAAQLADDLRQLEAIAGISTAATAGQISGPSEQPVDRLTAWILSQANLADNGAGTTA